MVTQAGQIEYLQPRIDHLADHQHAVAHHLDVTPEAVGEAEGAELAHHARRMRVGHLDEPGPVAFSEKDILPSIQRIGPAPDVVGGVVACHHVGHMGQQFNLVAGPDPVHESIHALSLSA